LDRAIPRFVAWIGASVALAAFVAPNFPSLLTESLDSTFGNVFPAIPFAGLLGVLFLLRWGDLREILLKEGGVRTGIPTRTAGAALVASLFILRPVTGTSVELSSLAVILAFYGVCLVLNPLARRMVLPYAAIYAVGVTAPAVLESAFAGPLISLSAALSRGLVGLTGLPVSWAGASFVVASKAGGSIAATITPGCSSVISVTTFLGLLGLMHMDLKKDLSSTVKFAMAGAAALVALNAVRIAVLIWVGYSGGAGAFWSLHDWVGYAMFIGFYLGMLVAYPRMGHARAFPGPGVPVGA
jgi:exosortase/archaeosortase family protein